MWRVWTCALALAGCVPEFGVRCGSDADCAAGERCVVELEVCVEAGDAGDSATGDAGRGAGDASGARSDAAAGEDVGRSDAPARSVDASPDAASAGDAATGFDAAQPSDAGSPDARSPDARFDMGQPDAGQHDVGVLDAAPSDATRLDGGGPDGGEHACPDQRFIGFDTLEMGPDTASQGRVAVADGQLSVRVAPSEAAGGLAWTVPIDPLAGFFVETRTRIEADSAAVATLAIVLSGDQPFYFDLGRDRAGFDLEDDALPGFSPGFNAAVEPGRDHVVRLELSGMRVTAYVDGEAVSSVTRADLGPAFERLGNAEYPYIALMARCTVCDADVRPPTAAFDYVRWGCSSEDGVCADVASREDDEVCDGVDQDCDQRIDEAPSDLANLWVDRPIEVAAGVEPAIAGPLPDGTFGAVWRTEADEGSRITFARLDALGEIVREEVVGAAQAAPDIVWTGEAFVIARLDEGNYVIEPWSAGGMRLGNGVSLGPAGAAGPALASRDGLTAVAWLRRDDVDMQSNLWLQRLGANAGAGPGSPVRSNVDDTIRPAISWTGERAGVAVVAPFAAERRVYYYAAQPGGGAGGSFEMSAPGEVARAVAVASHAPGAYVVHWAATNEDGTDLRTAQPPPDGMGQRPVTNDILPDAWPATAWDGAHVLAAWVRENRLQIRRFGLDGDAAIGPFYDLGPAAGPPDVLWDGAALVGLWPGEDGRIHFFRAPVGGCPAVGP